MSDETQGMGADVGVQKINVDGEMEESTPKPSRAAYAVFYLMVLLSLLGTWKLVELFVSAI